MHEPIPLQGKLLRQVVRGYFAYHAVPINSKSMSTFRHHVTDLWRRALRRPSQRDRSTWARIAQLAAEFLPPVPILHPWPSERFAVKYPTWQRGSPVRESRTPGSVRGVLSNGHSYSDRSAEERSGITERSKSAVRRAKTGIDRQAEILPAPLRPVRDRPCSKA